MKMVQCYETCSLQGQNPVSLRHLREKGTRLELPLNFLKAHLSVPTDQRETLLRNILERKIGFQTYKSSIIESSQALSQTSTKTSTPAKNSKKNSSSLAETSNKEPGVKTSTPTKENSVSLAENDVSVSYIASPSGAEPSNASVRISPPQKRSLPVDQARVSPRKRSLSVDLKTSKISSSQVSWDVEGNKSLKIDLNSTMISSQDFASKDNLLVIAELQANSKGQQNLQF